MLSVPLAKVLITPQGSMSQQHIVLQGAETWGGTNMDSEALPPGKRRDAEAEDLNRQDHAL